MRRMAALRRARTRFNRRAAMPDRSTRRNTFRNTVMRRELMGGPSGSFCQAVRGFGRILPYFEGEVAVYAPRIRNPGKYLYDIAGWDKRISTGYGGQADQAIQYTAWYIRLRRRQICQLAEQIIGLCDGASSSLRLNTPLCSAFQLVSIVCPARRDPNRIRTWTVGRGMVVSQEVSDDKERLRCNECRPGSPGSPEYHQESQ